MAKCHFRARYGLNTNTITKRNLLLTHFKHLQAMTPCIFDHSTTIKLRHNYMLSFSVGVQVTAQFMTIDHAPKLEPLYTHRNGNAVYTLIPAIYPAALVTHPNKRIPFPVRLVQWCTCTPQCIIALFTDQFLNRSPCYPTAR